MSKQHKFYLCSHCKKIIGLIEDKGPPVICCGDSMQELIPNTVEAAVEKHLPDIKLDSDTITVQVGSTLHPMLPEHHISFIYVQTKNGGQRKCLELDKDPIAKFTFIDDKPLAVYAYCNLHGLWKTEL